ncbi:unnamed protein product [Mesocestoides corti]|uniref:DUF3792 family protein n=1 Tax=Mesocestoides corti TaxID=53468 RepID=A0A0R3UQ26_MESCO|nr:unnamed protein product [Mesocestoides corti]
MNISRLVNLLAVASATTLLIIALAIGIEVCSNVFECGDKAVRIYGILLLVGAIFLVTTTILYFVSFFKNTFWIRISYVLVGILGVLSSLAGTLVYPYLAPEFWGQWLSTIAATIALSFTISVVVSFSKKKN